MAQKRRCGKDVHPILMSDEEEIGNKFDRHSPSWRTAPLTLLCRCLDKRWMDDPLAAKRLPRVNGNGNQNGNHFVTNLGLD